MYHTWTALIAETKDCVDNANAVDELEPEVSEDLKQWRETQESLFIEVDTWYMENRPDSGTPRKAPSFSSPTLNAQRSTLTLPPKEKKKEKGGQPLCLHNRRSTERKEVHVEDSRTLYVPPVLHNPSLALLHNISVWQKDSDMFVSWAGTAMGCGFVPAGYRTPSPAIHRDGWGPLGAVLAVFALVYILGDVSETLMKRK